MKTDYASSALAVVSGGIEVTKQAAVVHSGLSILPNASGVGVTATSASSSASYSSMAFPAATEIAGNKKWTIIALQYFSSTPTSTGIVGLRDSSSGSTFCVFNGFLNFYTGAGFVSGTLPSVSAGLHCVAITSNGDGTGSIYLDGVAYPITGLGSGSYSNDPYLTLMNWDKVSSPIYCPPSGSYQDFAGVFRACLPDGLLRQITGEKTPWQIFEDEEDYLFIPAAGGGSSVSLVVSEALHGHVADSPTFSMDTYLAVAESLHSHAADNLTLSATGAASLVVQDAAHGHVSDGVALTTQWLFSVADAFHGHAADNVALSTRWLLSVSDATHGHIADNLTLDTSNATFLTVQDAAHNHSADTLALSLDTWLAIVEAAHAHTADAPMLSLGQLSLQIADALHAMYSDIVFLTLPGGNLTTDQKFIIRATARRLAAIGLARNNIINRRAS